MANQITWFDIPVTDLDRAIRFYSAILGQEVIRESMPEGDLGILPHGENDVSGCLFVCKDNQPSDHGVLIYLNCSGRLDPAVEAVEPNGGQILDPKTAIGPYGFRAVVLDSEGNRIALHSFE